MNPLRLFDYVFYSIASLYDRAFGYKETCEGAGITFLSLIQSWNIIVIFSLINSNYCMTNSIVLFAVTYIVIVILNFIRYKVIIRYTELALKWDHEKKTVRKIKLGFVMAYVLSSIILIGI